MKKIRGKLYYFGRWSKTVAGKRVRLPCDGWEAALRAFERVAADLQAGRTPKPDANEVTLADLANEFPTSKQRKLDASELSARMFADYKIVCDRLIAKFGKTRRLVDFGSKDFASLRADLAKQYGPTRSGNEVQRTRTIFKFGYEARLLEHPMRFGPEFKKPSASTMRKHRAKQDKKLLSSAEARQLLDADGPSVRAMILLGLNAAFGNSDIATLPTSPLGLDAGWVTFSRPKTGLDRRAKLWPETVEAVKVVLDSRPKPKEAAHSTCRFFNRCGLPNLPRGQLESIREATVAVK